MIDWLIDCLIDWLIDWLTDWLTHWLTACLTDSLTDSLTDWLTDWRNEWTNGRANEGFNECINKFMNKWKKEGTNEWINGWPTWHDNAYLAWKTKHFVNKNITETFSTKKTKKNHSIQQYHSLIKPSSTVLKFVFCPAAYQLYPWKQGPSEIIWEIFGSFQPRLVSPTFVDLYGKCRQIYHTWILWVILVV